MSPATEPFGLRVAARPAIPVEHIEFAVLHYDDDQQIMLIGDDDQLVPWFRHTDGQTTTDSNTDGGGGGRETDTDWRED